jgi:hypothetical protein
MAMQGSGQITFQDIIATFGGAGADRPISAYYRGGAYVPVNVNFPYQYVNVWYCDVQGGGIGGIVGGGAPGGYYSWSDLGNGYLRYYYTSNSENRCSPYSTAWADNWQPRNTMVPTGGQIAFSNFYGSHDY